MALHPEKGLVNCGYCLVKSNALIPCRSCIYEMYCSEECRRQAYKQYHKIECKLWPYYLHAVPPDGCALILAVRTFLIGTQQGDLIEELMEDANFQNLFPERIELNGGEVDGGYANISNLETKKQFITAMDILICTKFIQTLKRFNYFNNYRSESDPYSQNMPAREMFATKLLIKHVASVKSNSFVVAERTSQTPYPSASKLTRSVGEGLIGRHALVNHSCDPNAAEFTRRRDHYLYALRPIKKDEQIFISYGYTFLDKTTSERREQQLKYYGFTCTCEACTLNWPVYPELKQWGSAYRTNDPDIISEIEKVADSLWKDPHLDASKPILAPWKKICNFRKKLHTCAIKPDRNIAKCEVIMEQCMRLLSNFYISTLDPQGEIEDVNVGSKNFLQIDTESDCSVD